MRVYESVKIGFTQKTRSPPGRPAGEDRVSVLLPLSFLYHLLLVFAAYSLLPTAYCFFV
jgi:hypothetical protein